jgi:hypothetical protein
MQYANISVRLGDEALARFLAAQTGKDDDVLLAVEQAIKTRLGLEEGEDPFSDPHGVFVDGLYDDEGNEVS